MTAKLPDGATSAGLPPKALATEGHAGTVLCRPAKKLVFGEHAVMADGNEHNLIRRKEKGAPVERRAEDIKARHTKYSKLRSFRGGAGRGCGKPAIEVSQSAGGERALAG